jgi:hypothetical protein
MEASVSNRKSLGFASKQTLDSCAGKPGKANCRMQVPQTGGDVANRKSNDIFGKGRKQDNE